MAAPPPVVLVQPPLRLARDFIDYPHLTVMAAAHAAGVLRAHGVQARVVDGMCGEGAALQERGDEAWLGQPAETFLARLEDLSGAVVLLNTPPFLLCSPGLQWLQALAERIHEAGAARLVLAEMYMGGMHHLDRDPASWLPRLAGDPLLLRFECEPLLARLAAMLRAGDPAPGGVWENREPIPLEDLPAPAWDLMDPPALFALQTRALSAPWRPGPYPPLPARTLPLVTARGCPFGCVFCTSNPGLPDRRGVRAIPLRRVTRWVRAWVEELGLERLVLLDEVANLDRRRFDRILALCEDQDLRLELPNGLRADRLTRSQVERVARLGSSLKVSLESASPRVQRDLLRKDLDPAAVERVARWCAELGLPEGFCQVHCMVGLPGEGRAEIRETLSFAAHLNEAHGARILLQNATPLPGTALHRQCVERGLIGPDQVPPASAFQGRSVITTEAFDPQLLRRAARALARRTGPAPAASKVIVNLTYRCNNRCAFCAVGDRPAEDADAREVIRQLRRHRARGVELLDIDGGEPTLHRDLLKVVRAARAMGYRRVALITNGRRLGYAAFTDGLVNAGVTEVLISLHAADEALNARLTSVPGAHAQTVAGLRQALAAMPSPEQVAVNTTVTGENLRDLQALGQQLAALGVRRWNLQLMTPFGRAEEADLPAREPLGLTLDSLLSAPPDGVAIQLVNCPPCLVPGHEEAAAADMGKAARDMVFVGAEGENLLSFLSARRRPTERCAECLDALDCPGEYRFK